MTEGKRSCWDAAGENVFFRGGTPHIYVRFSRRSSAFLYDNAIKQEHEGGGGPFALSDW